MSVQTVLIPCGALTLEGILHLPDRPPRLGVVLCHPHPLYGGSMDNNVVLALVDALVRHGVAALRFNFRGVAGSEGRFGGGVGETEDARAALDFLSASADAGIRSVALAGYSFGGGVALAAAVARKDLAALALVSPALGLEPVVKGALPMPKLFVTGEADPFATPEVLRPFASSLIPPAVVEVFPRTDHFWWGVEEDMAEQVSRFIVEAS